MISVVSDEGLFRTNEVKPDGVENDDVYVGPETDFRNRLMRQMPTIKNEVKSNGLTEMRFSNLRKG